MALFLSSLPTWSYLPPRSSTLHGCGYSATNGLYLSGFGPVLCPSSAVSLHTSSIINSRRDMDGERRNVGKQEGRRDLVKEEKIGRELWEQGRLEAVWATGINGMWR
jgi:hypothetical protein